MAETTTTTHISTSSRLSVRATNDLIRREIAPMNRLSKMYADLQGAGQVSFGHGGNQTEWRPTLMARSIRPGAGNPSGVAFNQVTTEKVCQLPWRTYDLGEHTTKMEKLATQGDAGYFGSILKIVKQLAKDFMRDYGPKLYLDGNATATNKDVHGLESWFGDTGALITNSVFVNPSDTYGGISTALGVTGSWTAESGNGWPTGVGDVEYHSFSPFIVDYNATGLGGSNNNWTNQWERAINRATTFQMVLQGITPNSCYISGTLLAQAKDSLESKQRFTTTADSNLVKLGHRTLMYDGIEVVTEYGIPQAVGYLLYWPELELRVMADQLIEMEEDYDIRTGQRLYKLDTYQNLVCSSPAYQGKLVGDVTAAGT